MSGATNIPTRLTSCALNSLITQKWDAIVIGAGPAGAFSALQLARAGKKVILLDKVHFPRSKVCGCCINQSAQRVLQRAGLDCIFIQSGAVPLATLQLYDGATSATIRLPGGHALSRDYFDNALISAAVAEGAQFMPGVMARVLESTDEVSRVQVASQDLERDLVCDLESKITIVADGLNGHALDQLPQFDPIVAANSRFGCGATFSQASAVNSVGTYYRPGRIYMACQKGGYVGLVVLENGVIDVACALDSFYVKQQESLPLAIAAILGQCNLPLPISFADFASKQWRGTDSLTRSRSKISGQRIFVVGDSCGYPEPLTGEGIAWALESAEALVFLALSAIERWSDALSLQWPQVHGRLLGRRQWKSRMVAYSLRNPLTRRALIEVASTFPQLAENIAASITYPLKQSTVGKVE